MLCTLLLSRDQARRGIFSMKIMTRKVNACGACALVGVVEVEAEKAGVHLLVEDTAGAVRVFAVCMAASLHRRSWWWPRLTTWNVAL
jgi:hypothetical protein